MTPQRIAGPTMLPPVSLPSAKPTQPAAVAAPGPALEPDEPSSSSHGLMVWPPIPDVVERQRAEAELGDQHRAGLVQAGHADRVGRRAPGS